MNNKYPTILVILCTHKYTIHAEQQIISIRKQINVIVKLTVSIDSDNDETFRLWKNLLQKYFKDDEYKIIFGPKEGFSSNFINAIIKSEDDSDFFAFSDHDDIWDINKLYKAVEEITSFNQDSLPILYGSRTRYVDKNGNYITLSKLQKKLLKFENALVQCFAGGNTMVFNKKLFNLVKKIGLVNVKSHDWWLYIIASAVNGKIIFDKNAYISYRQYEDNISGGNIGLYQALIRLYGLLSGNFKSWTERNTYYLLKNKELISSNNYIILINFSKLQNGNIFERIYYFFKSGIYRQSLLQNIALFISAILKKI